MGNSEVTSGSDVQLIATIIGVVGACLYALAFTAYEFNNWRGFYLSAAHVLLVAVGTWLALRKGR